MEIQVWLDLTEGKRAAETSTYKLYVVGHSIDEGCDPRWVADDAEMRKAFQG